MKLRYTLLAGLALASVASAAAAVTPVAVTGTVNVTGSVADRCQFTLASANITLNELTQNDGTLDPAIVNAGTADLTAWCNGTAATIAVQANPLINTAYAGPAVPGFTNRVDFTGAATANAVTVSDSSVGAASASAPSGVGIFTGNVHVVLSSSSASGKLIAGPYSGSVVVTLTPNVSLPPT